MSPKDGAFPSVLREMEAQIRSKTVWSDVMW